MRRHVLMCTMVRSKQILFRLLSYVNIPNFSKQFCNIGEQNVNRMNNIPA